MKTVPQTLKSTNERIDECLESIGRIIEKDEERGKKIKIALISLVVYTSLITLTFLLITVSIMVQSPIIEEGKEEPTLFKTLSFPSWLEMGRDGECIEIYVEGKKERTLSIGDEYLSLPHRVRFKVKKEEESLLLYGNGTLYGGYRNI